MHTVLKPLSPNTAGHLHKYGGFPEDEPNYQSRYPGHNFERDYPLRKQPFDTREYYLTIRNPGGQYDRIPPSGATDFRLPYPEQHPSSRKQYQYYGSNIDGHRYSDKMFGQNLPTRGIDRNIMPYQAFGSEMMFGPERMVPVVVNRNPAYNHKNSNGLPLSGEFFFSLRTWLQLFSLFLNTNIQKCLKSFFV